ncbi:hypothetical protein FGG08_001867 [Glutinoglossum americanum]|uniref:BHLH domain-containing protein n=1 Tax=Glutinoglossum americanum TaxID=1670608 RepID=A0A9P8I604_9PEZI|nr:hypothetical protein FGG08_001867 [Glutinoglossum americanum]
MDNLPPTDALPPVGTLIEQANTLEASLRPSEYGEPRLKLPAFNAANLVTQPPSCSYHNYFSTDILDHDSQLCRPEFMAYLRRLPAPRSPDSVRVTLTPRSPSIAEKNGHGLLRLSKESSAPISNRERSKRLKHTRKEQDRRRKNKAETDRLRGTVPECGPQTPKAEVLARANDYINRLEQQLQEATEKVGATEGRRPGVE